MHARATDCSAQWKLLFYSDNIRTANIAKYFSFLEKLSSTRLFQNVGGRLKSSREYSIFSALPLVSFNASGLFVHIPHMTQVRKCHEIKIARSRKWTSAMNEVGVKWDGSEYKNNVLATWPNTPCQEYNSASYFPQYQIIGCINRSPPHGPPLLLDIFDLQLHCVR